MKNTVEQAVRDAPVSKDDLVRWVNEEVKPLVRQMREALNACAIERSSATSDGAGTYVRVWTSPAMPTDAAWHIEALVAGMDAVAGIGQRAGYALAGSFASVAGVVSQIGATTVLASHESAAGMDTRLGVDATERVVYLEACDNALGAMNWSAVTQTHEVRL